MTTLYLDLETFSPVPIRNGTYAYAEQAEVMLFAYAIDDGDVEVWDLTVSSDMPADLASVWREAGTTFVAHNSMFDRTQLRISPTWRHGCPPVEQWFDTMVCALAHSLPGGLAKLCSVMSIPEHLWKHEGKDYINLFCKPRPKKSKIARATRHTHPEEWAGFVEYAKFDIAAMRELYKKLPRWNYSGKELELWRLDQKINDRGFAADLAFVDGAISAVEQEKRALDAQTVEMTNGAVTAATQRDKLLAHILFEHGVALPDMTSDTLERRLQDPDLPVEVKNLIGVRLESSTASAAKYKAVRRAVSADGRMRGTLQFDGANRTGRWAGRIFQPQNMFRPTMSPEEIEMYTQVIIERLADLMCPSVMKAASNTARGVIVAPKGRKLVIADLANIEGRGAAWLAGEDWKLEAFKRFDFGEGEDLYKVAYASSFGVDAKSVTKLQRQIGKVCLAEGTPVLTDAGVIAIEKVKPQHKLWDGLEWVSHKGLLDQGVRRVVDVAGIRLTPDHLVLTGGTWTPAERLVSSENTLRQALATGSANLPFWTAPSGQTEGCLGLLSPAHVGVIPMKSTPAICSGGRALGARIARPKRYTVSGGFATRMSCLKRIIGRAFLRGLRPPEIDVTTPATPAGTTTGREESGCVTNGSPTRRSSLSMFARFRVGLIRAWRWIAETTMEIMPQAISASSLNGTTCSTGETCKPSTPSLSTSGRRTRTYDLACAGPRTRFTVISNRGPLIVHNCELMLQYEGGVGAFVTGAATYGIDLEDLARIGLETVPHDVLEEARGFHDWVQAKGNDFGLPADVFVVCDALKRLWRGAHTAITSYWPELRDTARAAIESPGTTHHCRKVDMVREKNWLRIILPSGRSLCYPSPRVGGKGEISYMGVNSYTRRWERIKTYGGKMLENITQAFSRDVMAENMPVIEDAEYSIVLSVHDELLTETPDTSDYSIEELAGLMSRVPAWAEGLPLAAAGFETYRYRKD